MRILLLTLSALTAAPVFAAPPCVAPRCLEDAVPGVPAEVAPDVRFRVILPEGYDTEPETIRHPVLYLLHGAGDYFRTWSENTDLIDFTRALDLIVVMPSSGGTCADCGEAGWYTDWFDGSRKWETFHVDHLIPYVDAGYRTLGDGHRAVAGLSMGGYGAMKYAAKHPGLFRAAASFSGAVDIRHGAPANYVVFRLANPFLGTPDDRVWGNQVLEEDNWRANNPADLIESYKLEPLEIFLATGNGIPGDRDLPPGQPGAAPGLVGGAAIENGVWQMNVAFRDKLDSAGVEHTDFFYGPGIHSWPYWQDALLWALPQMLAVIK
ncbi:MAG: alpha/beta hydrolase [Candidatus Binatia bacterium]